MRCFPRYTWRHIYSINITQVYLISTWELGKNSSLISLLGDYLITKKQVSSWKRAIGTWLCDEFDNFFLIHQIQSWNKELILLRIRQKPLTFLSPAPPCFLFDDHRTKMARLNIIYTSPWNAISQAPFHPP